MNQEKYRIFAPSEMKGEIEDAMKDLPDSALLAKGAKDSPYLAVSCTDGCIDIRPFPGVKLGLACVDGIEPMNATADFVDFYSGGIYYVVRFEPKKEPDFGFI